METVGAAALAFGLVEGLVGVAQQGGGVGAILGKEGDADAGANPELVGIDGDDRFQAGQDPITGMYYGLWGGQMGDYQNKFIAAPAH